MFCDVVVFCGGCGEWREIEQSGAERSRMDQNKAEWSRME
jgi:hypothetical protein